MSVCPEPGCPHLRPCRTPGHEPDRRSPSSRETGRSAYRKIRERIQRDQPPCHWCGAPAATPDHLLPVSQGGASVKGNVVPACASCNYSRGARARPTRLG